jgi:hypothetical protein
VDLIQLLLEQVVLEAGVVFLYHFQEIHQDVVQVEVVQFFQQLHQQVGVVGHQHKLLVLVNQVDQEEAEQELMQQDQEIHRQQVHLKEIMVDQDLVVLKVEEEVVVVQTQ